MRAPPRTGFNPHSTVESSARPLLVSVVSDEVFQSSLNCRVECERPRPRRRCRRDGVSILTQLSSRVRGDRSHHTTRSSRRFNPHSTVESSASRSSWIFSGCRTRFQSSLNCRVECEPLCGHELRRAWRVSILTQLSSRVRAEIVVEGIYVAHWFQSSLNCRVECERLSGRGGGLPVAVSILTQLSSRVRAERKRGVYGHTGFNPHSTVESSARRSPSDNCTTSLTFQSSLNCRVECETASRSRSCITTTSFNPHSTVESSASQRRRSAHLRTDRFQSSLNCRVECEFRRLRDDVLTVEVSILTQLSSRVRVRAGGVCGRGGLVSILTQLSSRVRDLMLSAGEAAVDVSILTQLSSRVRERPSDSLFWRDFLRTFCEPQLFPPSSCWS